MISGGVQSELRNEADTCFVIEYEYAGKKWAGEIWADNLIDAEKKLRAMAFGRVLGERVMTIEVPLPGFIGRFIEWLMKRRK